VNIGHGLFKELCRYSSEVTEKIVKPLFGVGFALDDFQTGYLPNTSQTRHHLPNCCC